jgi:hypothetical protein
MNFIVICFFDMRSYKTRVNYAVRAQSHTNFRLALDNDVCEWQGMAITMT